MDHQVHVFDHHSHHYARDVDRWYQVRFAEFMAEKAAGRRVSLVDVGGGSGAFAKLALKHADVDVTILDPSEGMLDTVQDDRIKKRVGRLPEDIGDGAPHDFLHVSEVLHHLVGPTVRASRRQCGASLKALHDSLADDGYMFVSELYYEAFGAPRLTRWAIFWILKIQNRLRIRVPRDDFLLDLLVCFYTRKELDRLLDEAGFVLLHTLKDPAKVSPLERLVLLRRRGARHMVLVKKAGPHAPRAPAAP